MTRSIPAPFYSPVNATHSTHTTQRTHTPQKTHKLFPLLLLLFLFAIPPLSRAATLPPNLVWDTNTTDPLIGSPDAIPGGVFHFGIPDYPLTFRLVGPNNNDSFASWNRAYTQDFVLVIRHPSTDRHIPWMATHWSIQPDHKTIYFKLDPDARWSDGRPITADDYVFTLEMMRSKDIVDPFYNSYAENYYDTVVAIDPHTLMIVGKRPSWRPLDDYNLWPSPRHATKLGPNWVKEANNTPQLAIGPYVVTQTEIGKRVVFTKQKNWWGTNKRYFRTMYNVDRIELDVIPEERELDYFRNRRTDLNIINSSRQWSENTSFTAVVNGWVRKKRAFVDMPSGLYGLAMNLDAPIFKNKDFRIALQYLFDFETVNKNLMYGAYYRMSSAFTGTEYANPNLTPYTFDPRKAREHLIKAGYTRRGKDGILINEKGEPARFTVIFGTKTFETHLAVLQQRYLHFGIDMQLKLLDGSTAFNRGLERKYEMTTISRTAGFYPEPYQYFHSDFLKTTNNNNIWAFGSPETDKLIDVYRFNMDKQARLDAMYKLDQIIHDEAFYIPFWNAPYIRLLYWDKLSWPSFILPRRTQSPYSDWQVYWIDPKNEKRLADSVRAGKPIGADGIIDIDGWGVKAALEKKQTEAKSQQ